MVSKIIRFLKSNMAVLFILILILFMSIYSPDFFRLSSLRNLFIQISLYGIVACAMTFAIICGEFDLSVSQIYPLGTILFAIFMSYLGIIPAMIIAIIVGAVIGCINGFLVSILRINAFIATLSTMIITRGIALTICEGKPIPAMSDLTFEIGNGRLFGVIPYLALVFFALIICSELVLKKTTFGRNLFAVGGNYEVASYAGINVKFYKFIIFVILGCLAALAGTLIAMRIQAGSVLYGNDVALTVVSAAVIGGNSLAGGKGGALRTFLGMIFVGLLLQIFTFVNIYVYAQEAVKGVVVILVVVVDAIGNRKNISKVA
jgi:ribose transport system permease protein